MNLQFGREIPPVGPKGQFYVLGEAPGQNEDRIGSPFVGGAGNLLWRTLAKFGISRRQCRIANVFWRRPPANDIEKAKKSPLWEHYRKLTLQDIEASRPKAILALGAEAVRLLGISNSIKEARGFWFFWRGIPVMPTWHPAAVLRNFTMYLAFASDIKKFAEGKPPEWGVQPPIELKLKDADAFVAFCRELLHSDEFFACDIECAQHNGELQTSIIGLATTKAAVNAPPTPNVLSALRDLVQARPERFVFHNANFDLSWLQIEFGLKWPKPPQDTMIAHHILLADQPKSLEFAASLWLNVPAWKWLGRTGADEWLYNALDCYTTILLWPRLRNALEKEHAWEVYNQKRAELEVAIFMGLQGLRFSCAERERLREKLESEMQALEAKLVEGVGRQINFNSPVQMKRLLYEEWRLPPKKVKGKISAAEDAIKELLRDAKVPEERKEWLRIYLQWKKLSSLRSKELNVNPWSKTQRVHTTYNVVGTESARWSSSAPLWCKKEHAGTNLQNRNKPFRSMYLPPKEGWLFIAADYGGAEARIVAWRCNDEVCKKVFLEGGDIHKITASMMFGIPVEQVTKELRQIGKRIRHAANYGMSWKTLAKTMEISAAQAKDLLERYHRAYPKVREVFHKKTREIVQRTRMLRDAWGLPRFFSGRLDEDTFREAYSFYPQSTVTHTLNKALVAFWEWSKEKSWVKPCLQIHDEIVVACEPQAAEEVAHRLAECMAIEIPVFDLERELIEPLVLPTELKIGWNWGPQSEENQCGLIELSSLEELPKALEKLNEEGCHERKLD